MERVAHIVNTISKIETLATHLVANRNSIGLRDWKSELNQPTRLKIGTSALRIVERRSFSRRKTTFLVRVFGINKIDRSPNSELEFTKRLNNEQKTKIHEQIVAIFKNVDQMCDKIVTVLMAKIDD